MLVTIAYHHNDKKARMRATTADFNQEAQKRKKDLVADDGKRNVREFSLPNKSPISRMLPAMAAFEHQLLFRRVPYHTLTPYRT